ncbi:Putative protein [Zobellia galactanivorans]|uniref:Uncharacterized protein n=1 Tax=Zobellia galactanivorans (strain DSM 12802 / CCUG 47099 / CIP 106680 / NCIMB 13871 / Dsij) TaxID=63186 RepID=G0L693_ZOBGA|nr:Putative protein [Zobellia galactanivorans]
MVQVMKKSKWGNGREVFKSDVLFFFSERVFVF